MKKKIQTISAAAAICVAIITVLVLMGEKPMVSPAYAVTEVLGQQSYVSGRSVGDVLVGNQVVFRIRTAAGGFSPYQRAQIVADRLQKLVSSGALTPEEIRTGRVNGQAVVMADGQSIITADGVHARLNQTTPTRLSDLWARNLEDALAGRPVGSSVSVDTPVSEKLVPVVSVGKGARVGGALVAGAKSQLDKVIAVAQVEGELGSSVRVRVLIPVSSENVVQNIKRVPETAVIGLVDVGI